MPVLVTVLFGNTPYGHFQICSLPQMHNHWWWNEKSHYCQREIDVAVSQTIPQQFQPYGKDGVLAQVTHYNGFPPHFDGQIRKQNHPSVQYYEYQNHSCRRVWRFNEHGCWWFGQPRVWSPILLPGRQRNLWWSQIQGLFTQTAPFIDVLWC